MRQPRLEPLDQGLRAELAPGQRLNVEANRLALARVGNADSAAGDDVVVSGGNPLDFFYRDILPADFQHQL